MDEVGLGRQLQAARKKAGLTQQDLCHKAGLSYSTLAKIERGAIKSPSIFTIQSIAAALGISLNELMGDLTPRSPAAKKHRSKSGIRFVYFDINGCLVRFFHRAFTKLAADTTASADVIETTFWHYNDAVCRGEMALKDFNQTFAKQLGMSELDWQQYYLGAVDPIAEMHELVRWASQNYDVGLLSNIMPGFIEAMLAAKLLPDIPYAAIIDSSAVGAIKPEPKIYEIAAAKAGVPAEEILLVDDSRANVMAAEKLGWHVLWFDDFRPEESAARVKNSLEIDSTYRG
ncbi:MAG TPA: HAD-IA family hydrolase [Candidatus Saccharimonadales bacterium]|nr:HAD-IA family hydrolase [Candidatus Saccharimonadales bacterium]